MTARNTDTETSTLGLFDEHATAIGYVQPTDLDAPITPLSSMYAIHGDRWVEGIGEGSLYSLRVLLRLLQVSTAKPALAQATEIPDWDEAQDHVRMLIEDVEGLHRRLGQLTGQPHWIFESEAPYNDDADHGYDNQDVPSRQHEL